LDSSLQSSHYRVIPISLYELLSLPKTNINSEGSGNVTGLKFENPTRTQPRTSGPFYCKLTGPEKIFTAVRFDSTTSRSDPHCSNYVSYDASWEHAVVETRGNLGRVSSRSRLWDRYWEPYKREDPGDEVTFVFFPVTDPQATRDKTCPRFLLVSKVASGDTRNY